MPFSRANSEASSRSCPSAGREAGLCLERPLETRNHPDVGLVLQFRAQLHAPMLVKERLPPMARAQLGDQHGDSLSRSFLVHDLQIRQQGLDERTIWRFQYCQLSALTPPRPPLLNVLRAVG